jgi:hypothetical protein
MAAVSIPHNDPWIVARWAFRILLQRTSSELGLEEDKSALEQAIALDGLHFDLLPVDQAQRLARALEAAAEHLRVELGSNEQSDPREAELAEALATLEMRLHDVFE